MKSNFLTFVDPSTRYVGILMLYLFKTRVQEASLKYVRNAIFIHFNFPQSQPLVKDCQFGASRVNNSDSDSEMHKSLESSNFGQLPPMTTKVAAIEHLKAISPLFDFWG